MNGTIELTKETQTYRNKTMYRIKMKPTHPYYNKVLNEDKLGGWIEEGVTIDEYSWMCYDAMAFGNTEIKGGVFITGDSKIYSSNIDALGFLKFVKVKNCNLKGVLNVTGYLDISSTELDGILNVDLNGSRLGSNSFDIKKCKINGSLDIHNVFFLNILNSTFIDNTLITSPLGGNVSVVRADGAVFQGGVKIITGYRDMLRLNNTMMNKAALINRNENVNSSLGGLLDEFNFSNKSFKEEVEYYGN